MRINKNIYNFVQPNLFVFAFSSGYRIREYLGEIDYKKNCTTAIQSGDNVEIIDFLKKIRRKNGKRK